MFKFATIALLVSASAATADGLPITGAYGSKWACATYKSGGADAVFSFTGATDEGDGLVLPDRYVEPNRSCIITKQDGELVAVCTAETADKELHYTNSVIFKRLSATEIFYGEVRFGTNYRRCR